MIALIDDLDKKKVTKNSNTISKKESKSKSTAPKQHALRRLRNAFSNAWAGHKKRKTDKIALHQLMQIDDALLKDMGLSRYDLMSVRSGHLTFDALVKRTILSNRDNACSTTSLRK